MECVSGSWIDELDKSFSLVRIIMIAVVLMLPLPKMCSRVVCPCFVAQNHWPTCRLYPSLAPAFLSLPGGE
jgi:hypothetical protein